MQSFLTDYGFAKLTDYELGGAALTPPASWYFGLSTQPALRSGATTYEVAGGSYARAGLTNNMTNFPAASFSRKQNATAINFPTPTGSWGQICSWFIADAPTGGNVWRVGDLPQAWTIGPGSSAPSFAPGTLLLSRSMPLTDFAANAMLNFEFGLVAPTIPATWFFGLSTEPPNKVGLVINVYGHYSEISGGSYGRPGLANNLTNFPAASSGAKANGAAITFPTPTATWGSADTPGGPVASIFTCTAGGGTPVIWRFCPLSPAVSLGTGSTNHAVAIGGLTLGHL